MSSEQSTRTGCCARCTEETIADGKRAGPRAGRLLCADCADKGVVYVTECLDCGWTYRQEGPEYNWFHIRQRVQQEGNSHESEKKAFEDESHETVWRRYDE